MTEIPTEISETAPARRLSPWVIVAAFLLLLGFLTILGLGLKRSQSGPITIGQSVPPFTLTTFEGQQINLKDLNGKVVVVNFWASWCKPCESEAADLESAWKFYQPGNQVVFLGIAWTDTEPEAKAYIKKFDITYTNGPDLGTRISQQFRILGVPETYIIDKNGKLAFKEIGPFGSVNEIKAVIDPLIQ